MTGTLNDQEINNILQSQSIARIASCYRRIPYLVPITYFYDGRAIYAQSVEGLKIKMMRRNPFICLQIDIINGMKNWKSVVINGVFEELKGEASEKARKALFEKVYILQSGPSVHYFEHEQGKEMEDKNRIKPILFRIKIVSISGRYENF